MFVAMEAARPAIHAHIGNLERQYRGRLSFAGFHRETLRSRRTGRVLRRGTLVCPDVGEVLALKRLTYQNPADLTLKLYKTNVSPAESDTNATYTIADFTGYSNVTLTATQAGGTWAVPTTSSGTSSTTYAQQTWTLTGTSQTIYGYNILEGTTLFVAELFATARTLGDTDQLKLTPRLAQD
jgi:hypothetical protein